jgi:uncharacterized protein involved in exopolysaccharide biosynthesis
MAETLAATPATVVLYTDLVSNPALAKARAAFDAQSRQLAEALGRLPPRTPEVQALRQRVKDAERVLANEETAATTTRTGSNPIHDALATQLVAAQAERDAALARKSTITAQLADIGTRLRTLAREERPLNELLRDRELATSTFRMLSDKLQEARVADQAALREVANVRELQPPRVPMQPHSVRPLIMLLGGFLAFCASLAVAFLSDLMRQGFMTPDQLERALGVPVLAAVPLSRSLAGRLPCVEVG